MILCIFLEFFKVTIAGPSLMQCFTWKMMMTGRSGDLTKFRESPGESGKLNIYEESVTGHMPHWHKWSMTAFHWLTQMWPQKSSVAQALCQETYDGAGSEH